MAYPEIRSLSASRNGVPNRSILDTWSSFASNLVDFGSWVLYFLLFEAMFYVEARCRLWCGGTKCQGFNIDGQLSSLFYFPMFS